MKIGQHSSNATITARPASRASNEILATPPLARHAAFRQGAIVAAVAQALQTPTALR
jgi:hypothetical protein